MPKALMLISKKIIMGVIVILFAASMALTISPGKIYGDVLVTSIKVTSAGNATSVANGGTLQMSAEVFPADATNKAVKWSISPLTGEASIDNTGMLTVTEVGMVYVIATANDGSRVSGSSIITVIPIPVTSITVTGAADATTLEYGSSLQMSAAVLPSAATDKGVTWSAVKGTGSATIDTTGLLTGTGVGTVKAKATANDGSNIFGTLEISVTAPTPPLSVLITSIILSGAAGAITVSSGSTLQMSAEILPAGATDKVVNWSVAAGTGSATINTSGLLTGTGVGTVTVTATADDGSAVLGTFIISITAQAPQTPPSAAQTAPASSTAQSYFASAAVYEKTITGFVTLFYNRILNRAPDIEGLKGWVTGLTSGTLTGADLVRGFIFSEENEAITAGDSDEQFITTLYHLVFDRAPDAGGLKSWLANISGGMTKEKVINYFTSSSEFTSLCTEYGVRP